MTAQPLRQAGRARIACVTLTAAVLAGALTACGWLARPIPLAEDLAPLLDAVEASVHAGDWQAARAHTRALRRGWERNRLRIHFQAEIAIVNEFERGLDRLEAAVRIEDRSAAALAAAELRGNWEVIAATFR